jgi:hypothetical protein
MNSNIQPCADYISTTLIAILGVYSLSSAVQPPNCVADMMILMGETFISVYGKLFSALARACEKVPQGSVVSGTNLVSRPFQPLFHANISIQSFDVSACSQDFTQISRTLWHTISHPDRWGVIRPPVVHTNPL